MMLGVYGYHDTGKTLFLEKIMRELKKRGITAAAVKHLGRHYEEDKTKDTGRLAAAGFNPVIGVANEESIIHIDGRMDIWGSIGLVHRLAVADVIFVEGFKNEPIEKIAVGDINNLPGTKFRSEQFKEILAYIEEKVEGERQQMMAPCCCGEGPGSGKKNGEGASMSDVKLKIVVNGKKIAANEFVQNIVWETLCGMTKSLKGVGPEIKSIEISASKE